MQILKVFGTIGLIFVTGIASFSDENLSDNETSECATPIAYNISWKIQNTHLIVVSNVDIDFTCTQQYIRLHIGRYCDIQTLQVKPNGSDSLPSQWKIRTIVNEYFTESHTQFNSLDINFIEHNRTSFKAEDTDTEQHIIIHEGLEITPGRYTIYSTHSCHLEKVATVSTYITKLENQSENKEFLISTRIPAEWIFPCWKNPATTATFTIHIEHKNTENALSNIEATTIYEAEKIVYTGFNITSPILTHLVAVAIVPASDHVFAKNKFADNISIRSRAQEIRSTFYARFLIQDINRLINPWNAVIPRSRYVTYLILPGNSTLYEAIVTTELVTFSEADIIYDVEVDSIIRKREVTSLVVRSVIQEMFSDWIVTFKHSFWFIEGFSTIYGMYIHDKYYRTTLLKSSVVQTRRIFFDYSEALMQYDLSIQDSLISPKSTLSKLWQEKAFSTFYMFETIFGKDLLYTSMFKKAANLYYNTISNDTYNQPSLLDKFWDFNYEALLHKHPDMQIMAKRILTSWTAKVGYPVVQVIHHNMGTQKLNIMVIDCLDIDHTEPCYEKWWIPVALYKVTTTDILLTYQSYVTPHQDHPTLPVLMKNEFAIVVNSSGYRVNYDRQSWRNIALFLKNTKITHAELPDVTLAQILDDAFYFLVQNTMYNDRPSNDIDIYFDIASSVLRVDTSYIAWYPLLSALENLSKNFLYSESVNSRYIKDRILAILNKFLDDIDVLFDIYSSENSVKNQLYHEVLKWTCLLGSAKCDDHVNAILELHFNHPAKAKLLPSWQTWLYCQGLRAENTTYNLRSVIWRTLVITYRKQSKTTELFKFLLCSRDKGNLLNYISALTDSILPTYHVLPRNISVSKSDTLTFIFNMFAKHSNNFESLSSIIQTINLIGREINLNIVASVSCIINNIYSDEGLWMITDKEFLQNLTNIHYTPLFVLDAIKEKARYHSRFLAKMRNT